MKTTKFIFTALTLCVILTFINCQTLGSAVQEPVVSLHSVELTNINLNTTTLLATLSVKNPNSFDIPFPAVNWELFINENSFISGVLKNNERLQRRSTTLVEIPVTLDYLEIINTFVSFRGRSHVDFKIALSPKITIPLLGEKVWNFSYEGSLSFPQVPRLSSPVIRVERMDLSAIELFASVNVENHNVFELPPPRLNIDYRINNVSFITSTSENIGNIPANSSTPVAFALVIQLSDLFRLFPALLTSSSISTQLNLSFDFDVPFFRGEAVNLQIPYSLPLRR